MAKKSTGMRAVDIAARMLDNRPIGVSCAEWCYKHEINGSNLTVDKLERRMDIGVGLLYQLCKALGYQIMVYNPKPPEGMKEIYVVGERKCVIVPREKNGKIYVKKDPYTGKLYTTVRKYKRKKKPLRRIDHDAENS